MKTRAAIAWEPSKPLEIEEIELEAPKKGEVLIRNIATGVCHTDAYTLSGVDPEGLFPSILGHEGGAIVEETGPGVKLVKKYYETEASGNINLKTVKSVARTGVNRISVGNITHSAPAIDFKLEI